MSKDVLYLKIANSVTEQIKSETLQFGERLPSLRSAQKLYNVSLNTVKQAYMELESRSLVESRPKYGYYVSQTSQRKLALPSVAQMKLSEKKIPRRILLIKYSERLKGRILHSLRWEFREKPSSGSQDEEMYD
jgi:DNA-binding GntR family transcriptional regulator